MGALRILRKRMQRQFSKRDRRETRGRSPAPAFEFLEQRLLLSADSLTSALARPLSVDLHDGLNDVTLRLAEVDGGSVVQIVDQTGGIQAERLLDEVTEIAINGADYVDDILRIDLDSPLPVSVSFHGGDGGSDTLRGPLADSAWSITGTDSGEVEGIQFSGVENLIGAAENEDTFVIAAGGSVSGLIEGGAGGFDSLKIAEAGYSTITFRPTGPDSGSLSLDGVVIQYAGLEPVDSGIAPNVVFDLTAITDGDFTLDHDAGDSFKLSGGVETTSFGDPGAGNSVTINLGSGNDAITLKNLLGAGDPTTLNASVIIAGGVGDDTYVLDDKWGPNVTFKELAADTGTDTLDFGPYSDGGNKITIAPQVSGDILITGVGDGSTLTLDTTAKAFDSLINAEVDLTGSLASVKAELVDGLKKIVTFVRNLAASGNFLTALPVIGKNADVTVSKALDFAEALDEIRFQVEQYFDGLPSLTTQDLINFLNDKFQAGAGYVGPLLHFGAAIFSAKSIASTLAGEEYDFKLTIDGVVYHVKGIEALAAAPAFDTGTKTLTFGFTAGLIDAEGGLLPSINAAISTVDALSGQIGVAARNGRLAFQVVSTEINEFKLAAGNALDAAATKLGLETADPLPGSPFVLSNVQEILKGLGDLNVSLATGVTLAVAFEGGVPKLRFDVNYRAARTSKFFFDFGPQAQSLGLAFDVEAQIFAMAELVADFQLGLGLQDATTADFFLDVDALRAGISLTASAVTDVGLNLGFLGLEANGTLALDAGLTVDTTGLTGITNPTTIVIDPLTDLTLTKSDGTGTPTFNIDLTLTVDAGTKDIGFVASGTLTATGNPFDGSSIALTTDTSFDTNFPDFNNLNSAGVVSLLGQVAGWLDGLRGGELISSINIPFVEGGLDKILDLAEVLSDALLFDEGPDDVKDGADKLVTDLNAALANAKLDTLIRAEGDGAKVSFVAIDPAITAFTVSKGSGDDDTPVSDGFEELGITSPTAASLVGGVLKVVASLPGPLLGQLLGEMAVIRFNITRNGSSKDTDVTLLKTATTDNKGIGDDQPKLLDADNAPTFANAQELADRLTEILSSFLPGSVHYNATDKVLTYDVSFTDVNLFSVELPVDFELDLSPVGNIASNTRLIIDATGGINFTLGFDISANPPASSGALADGTAFGDLNVPVTVKLEEAASADSTPRTLVGQLSGDATFTISYNPTGMLTVPALTAGVAGTDINVTKRADDQSETAIAVNPVNPDNIIIGANDLNTPTIDSVWVTHDGGAIWNIVTIPNTIGVTAGHNISSGDPSLVFSRDGSVVIYTHMIEKTNGDTVIVSVRSINGGDTWIDERVIGSMALDEDGDTINDSNDKNYIAVGPDVNDLTSDRFIITWQRHNVIYASTSTDNGLVWTAPVVVGGLLAGKGSPVAEPSGSSIDAIPSFGPNGEIYVAWEDFGDSNDGVSRIKFDSSLDGGVTWGGGMDRTVYWGTSNFLISDLSLADQAKLDDVAAAMNANPLLIATIAGYTDRAGDPGPNQTLSDNRADAVFTYLNTTKGIAAGRLTKLGFGETHLAVSTLDGVANAANRRAEVTLDEVIYTGYVNVFRDPFGVVAGQGLDGVDETTSPVGLGEYEIPGQDTRGIWMGLSMDVDLSGSAKEGRIYLAFTDQGDLDGNAATGHHDTDIFVIASDDDGVTWDALALSPDVEGADQVQVNDDMGTASQWFSWLDVDPSTGTVAVSWYDTRNDTGVSVDADTDLLTNTGVQYFAAVSRDFGLTWDPNIPVSDGTSNVSAAIAGAGTAANQFGDYSALAFNNSTIYMAWADNSNSTLDHVPAWPASLSTEVYFDTIDLTNQTFQDLLDDINFALAGVTVGDGPDAGGALDVLGEKFQAQAAAPGSNTVKIVALDPTITSFTVTVENTNDPTFRDLGFQLSSTAVNEGGTLVVKGAKNVPTIVGQLTADASFDIDLDGVGLGLPVTVTVQRADTVSDFAPNRNILDLVFDVQKAIDNSTIGAGVIKVSSDHGRLLFTRLGTSVLGDGDEFTITPGANAGELGITGTLTSDEADIVITESDGITQHRIVLDGVTTIGGLITAINTQSGGAITASKTTDDPTTPVNEANTGLTLIEAVNPGVFSTTTSAGSATTLNDSGHNFLTNGLVKVGDAIFNLTDGSKATVVTLGNGSLTTTPLAGGTENDWDSGDQYSLGKFKVDMVNGSLPAVQLGIIGTDINPQDSDDVPDGKIVGATIAGAKLLDRFFITAPGANLDAIKNNLNHVLSANLEVSAGAMLSDIKITAIGGGKTTITANGFDFTKLGAGDISTSGIKIEIENVAGFAPGAYLVTDVIDETHVKLGSITIGAVNQEAGAGILRNGLDASASFGFIGIDLDGTAELGAELSWGFNTAVGAPAADGRLTAQEIIDGISDPLSLMLVPDLTPIPVTGTTTAPGTATTLTDSNALFETNKRVQVGDVIRNLTDGSHATIASIDSDTQLTTAAALTGGTENDWDSGDDYEIIIRNFGVVDASVGLDIGGDLSGLAAAIGAENPRITLRVLTLGDPFIGTRFEQANYSSGGGTTFTVDGDFTGKLPTGATLRFGSNDFTIATAVYASSTTTVTVTPSGLPTSLTDVDVVLLPKVDVDTSDLGDILPDFSNLSFADIIAMLQALANFLGQFESFGFLKEPIPLIDKSVNDLLGFAEEFATKLDELQSNPAGTLQLLENKINESLGIASSTLTDIYTDLSLGPAPTDVINLSYDVTAGILKFDLVWGTSFSKGLDVAIPELDFGGALSALGLGSLLDLSGSANLVAEGSVLARLTLGMDVVNFDIGGLLAGFSIDDLVTALGDHLFVFDTTGLDAHLKVGGEDIAFRVGVGPFALSIRSTDTEQGDASTQTAEINLEGGVELGFKDTVFDPNLDGLDPDDDRVSFSDLFGNLSLSNIDAGLTGTIEGVLPVFFPNDSHQLGAIRIGGTDGDKTFTAAGDLVNLVTGALGGGSLNFELISADQVPDTADPATHGVQGTKADAIAIDVSDIIAGISGFDFSHFSIFDNIILAVDGLDLVLETVQDLIGGQNFSFPLIGGDLAKAAGFIGDLRNDFISPLREAIETAKDTAQDFSDPNKNIISIFLFDILGPGGVNLLLPRVGSPDTTKPGDYIGLDTNLEDFLFNPSTTLELEDTYIEWDINLGSHIADETFDIGFDLGIPGLGLKTEGDLTLVIDWALDLAFGLNFKDGFFIRTDDPDELLFNIDVGLPAAITGTLGFLGLRGEDKELDFGTYGTKDTGLGATFKVDIFEKDGSGNPLPNNPLNPNEDGDRLGFTEFGSIGFDFGVAAEASAALGLTLGLSNELFVEIFGPGASSVISGFPTIKGDFRFLWQLGNRGTGTTAQEIADNSTFVSFSTLGSEGFGAIATGLKLVSIEDITLDLGSFISEVLGPIVDEVSKFTGPIQPLIDFISSPVPIIGQLGLDITWMDLAELVAGDKLNFALIKSIAEIVTLINDIVDLSGAGPVMLPIGDFIIYDPNPIGFAPNIWDKGLDLDQTFEDAKSFAGVIGNVFGLAGTDLGNIAADAISGVLGGLGGDTASVLKGAVDGSSAGGFDFPFLKHPDQIFGLLMGKPADLVTYDLGALNFEFEFHQFFSIFGPLGVSIGLLVQFMADTAFGYDTQGIQDFVESDFRNPALLFNGFYISDSPKLNGVDDPELTFLAELQAAAELNLGIARAGVAAAFGFKILFDLFDPNHDLKIRFDELLGNIANQLRAPDEAARLLAPLAIFDVSGEIFARLFAFLNIDFGFFTFEKEFPIFGPVTLLSFDIDFFRPPILASEQDNGDLIINTGQFANQRLLGNATDLSEHIIIHKTGTSGDFINVEISGGGMRDNLGDDSTTPLPFKVRKGGKIIIDGGQGDDYFQVTGFAPGDVLFEIDLGVGNDTLELTGGIEGKFSTIQGGAGDDTIGGSAGSDLIFGGMGIDNIMAGDGSDLVFGDEGEIGTDSFTALVRPTDGVDTIDGEGGSDILIGGGAKDHIVGGTGGQSDMLIGGGGVVFFKPGAVKIFQNIVGIQDRGVQDVESQLLDTKAGDVLIGDGGDIIYGTAGPDVITGTDENDIIFGMGGADTIDGADGNDIIFGDSGQIDPGAGGSGTATGGNATTLTDSGAHFLANGVKVGDYVRNETEATFVRVTAVTSDTTVETEAVGNWSGSAYSFFVPKPVAGTGDAPDVIQGGAGNDLIFGGGGGDFIAGGIIFGLGDPDPGNLANDKDQIYGGSGPDVLVGDNVQVDSNGKIALDGSNKEIISGNGADRIFGEGEPDKLFGGGGFDLLDGGAGSDVVKGGDGADTLLFNKGSDRLDGEDGGDSYFANFQGGNAESLVIAQDSGTTGADLLAVNGTVFDDQFLLRANTAGTDAFIAMIKDAFFVERINYGGTLERILINGSFGDDHFAIDDTAAELTINGDFGDDTFQVGQMFRSQRTPAAANVSVNPFDDTFATIETTRGFLSNGISKPMTINGGLGNDLFVVFHNKAVLQLNGEEGDDTFEIRAFALVGSQEPQRERTDLSGGAGADLVMYAVNAPVNIDGGDGFDTVVIIGTEFGDDFVVTEDGVFGAGLTVSFVNIESLRIDAAEGNDRIFVQSTSEKFITEVFGGLGEDTIFMSGDTPPIVSNDLRGHSGVITHDVESSDLLYDGQNLFGISANVADNDEPFIVVRPTDGSTIITEGSTEYDEFQLVLTRDPGREILVFIAAPLPTGSSRERGAQMFRVESPDVGPDPDDVSENGTSLTLRFDSTNWYAPKTVQVIADDTSLADQSVETFPIFTRPEIADATTGEPPRDFTMNDMAYEGIRFGVVNISVQASVVNEDSGAVYGVNITKDQITVDKPTSFTYAELIGQNLKINSGPGFGQNRFIRAVADGPDGTKVTLTLDRPYGEEVPDATSVYLIQDDDSIVGKMDSFDEDTAQLITDGTIPASTDPNDQRSIFVDSDGDFPIVGQGLTGATLEIVAGAGLGQQRLILGNTATTLILNGPWRTNPDDTSIYRIERYDGMALPSVSVQVNDDDRPGLIIDETKGFLDDGDNLDNAADVSDPDFDTITAVIEGGNGDHLGEKDVIQVRLSADPGGTSVQVGLIYDSTQLEVRDLATNTVINNTDNLLTFSDLSAKSLSVTALVDGLREGFHTSLIQFEIHTGSADISAQTATEDFRTFTDAAVFFVGLEQTPNPTSVQVFLNGSAVGLTRVDTPDINGLFVGGDFFVANNKVVFVNNAGDPLAIEGTIEVQYTYNKRGFLSALTAPVLTRINDFEAPTVVVRETAGSTDVIELKRGGTDPESVSAFLYDLIEFFNASPWNDSYELVLSAQPSDDVTVTVSPAITKTTRTGGIRHDADQVEVFNLAADPRVVLETFTADIAGDATTLVDSDAQFITKGIKIGDLVRSLDEGVFVKVTDVVSETELKTEAIGNWSGDNYSFGNLIVTFSDADWDDPVQIGVRALDDGVVDGADTQVFAPGPATLSGILGPVVLQGAGGAGSLSLGVPVLLPPNETNLRTPDGAVYGFVSGTGFGATERMTVHVDDLQDKVDADDTEGDALKTIDDLIGLTIEMARGQGLGVVLNPERPNEAFDRFWLIKSIATDPDDSDLRILELQNPSQVDPSTLDPTDVPIPDPAPDPQAVPKKDLTQAYAITALSPNFFVDERTQVDVVFVHDEDSPADSSGVLTSTRLYGFNMGPDLVIGGQLRSGGITYDDFEVIEVNLGKGNNNLDVVGTHTREDGYQTWTLINTGDETVPFADVDNPLVLEKGDDVTLSINATDETFMGSVVNAVNADLSLQVETTTVTVDQAFVEGSLQGSLITIDADGVGNTAADGQTRRIINNIVDPNDNTQSILTVDQPWEILPIGEAYTITNEADGSVAVNLQAGDDELDASGSDLGIVVFGGLGLDNITGGGGDDILFGDRGRVDYFDENDAIVTRLGYAPEPITGFVTSQVVEGTPGSGETDLFHLEDTGTKLSGGVPIGGFFPVPDTDGDPTTGTEDIGLRGLYVDINNGFGFLQTVKLIDTNTATVLTLAEPFDVDEDLPGPVSSDPAEYRISTYPEDQTDGVVRAPTLLLTVDNGLGDMDTINGGGGNDQVFGGAGGDVISAGGDDDVVIGDVGRIDRSRDPDAPAEPAFGDVVASLPSLVRTIDFAQGDDDTINGDAGDDILIGGTEDDTIDGGGDLDIVLGDQGKVTFVDGKISLVQDPGTTGDDTLSGGADFDLVIGGLGDDTIDGNAGPDILIGDEADVNYDADGVTIVQINTVNRADGGVDTIYGGSEDDILIGGTNSDNLDGGLHQDLIFGDNVLLVLNSGSGDAIDPRFRALTGTTIYGPDGLAQVSGEFSAEIQPVPGGRPAWGDWHITLDQTLDLSHFGNDYIAGGGGNDEIFGQRGDETIQGDGSIDFASSGTYAAIGTRVGAMRDSSNALLLNPSSGAATDGDDYIEGNSGNDVIFGNLGQDDIIGGTSKLFSLMAYNLRDDGSDLIFGGPGTDAGRNDLGDASATGHARDADVILADNGNIFRLVGVNGQLGVGATGIGFVNGCLAFNYDTYSALRIVPRAAQLLEYTPGGPDFNAAGAATDIGAADEVHGGQGDDFIYGMVGSDVLFGDGQDDDMIGGYGNDWISGGTGQDGVIGDDGRISTSRNGTAEPLYGLAATTQTTISTPGNIMQATINATGQLKKTVNLTPFSVDPNWNSTSTTDEFGGSPTTHRSDDIIYGGWGSDFLHGGSGDDAISGAEALPAFFAVPANLGNVLGYDPTTGMFADYDEYNPLAYIPDFLLNFDKTEGPEVVLSGFPTVNTDGNDVIFGDLGNDWVVGGTGNDHVYGGWGNDLLNADDDLDTAGGANTGPDSNPSYQDIAFGGAGLDVLIANTGGDRLIDWVGEYNSYIVPFSPFGLFTVLRLVLPQLPEFLYALSRADGADPTRSADNGGLNPTRNGEPYGELGLIIQQDPEWTDQTGAPRDPQPGNTSSQKRDILGKETFTTTTTAFAVETGTWSVNTKNATYTASGGTLDGGAISLYDLEERLPAYYEIVTSINAAKTSKTANLANGYVVFDYQSNTNFKFVGLDITSMKIVIGHRTASGWLLDAQLASSLSTGKSYDAKVTLNGATATISVNNTNLSYTFVGPLNGGMVGLAARKSVTSFGTFKVQVPPTVMTVIQTADFTDGSVNPYKSQSGTWVMANGVYTGTAASGATALSTTFIDVVANSRLDMQANIIVGTSGVTAGIVFDYQGPMNYKFAAMIAGSDQVVIGHVTSSGMVIDATIQHTIVAGTGYLLGVSLDGNTVRVVHDGTEILTKTYYSLLNDGALGLLSKDGTSIFDNVVISGDDPAYLGIQTLLASTPPEAALAGDGTTLTVENLETIADAAIDRLSKAYALDAGQWALLESVNIQIIDLGGLSLGETNGTTIRIDANAAGYGWFIDSTPLDDAEYSWQKGVLMAGSESAAAGDMDLLTVVMHEFGHVLGFGDLSSGTDIADLMFETLSAGVRRVETHFATVTPGTPALGTWYYGQSSEGHRDLFEDWFWNLL